MEAEELRRQKEAEEEAERMKREAAGAVQAAIRAWRERRLAQEYAKSVKQLQGDGPVCVCS